MSWFGEENPENAIHADALFALWRGDFEDGTEGRAAVFAAATKLIRGMPRPMMVLVDDGHWVDPSTIELLDRIFPAPSTYRMMLVLTRSGTHFGSDGTAATRLCLRALAPEATARIIESVCGGKVEAALARRIAAVTDGLPLYVEEYTKSLIESDLARWERSVLRATNVNAQATTPASLLDLITSRLDALGEAKLLAQISSVLGRSFDRAALVEVSGENAAAINVAVLALLEAGIFSVDKNGRPSFRHALFQRAAYESLVRPARVIWHTRYLDWLHADPKRLKRPCPRFSAIIWRPAAGTNVPRINFWKPVLRPAGHPPVLKPQLCMKIAVHCFARSRRKTVWKNFN